MRILILLAKDESDGVAEASKRGDMPRPEYTVLQDALHADRLDFSHVRASTHPLVRLARAVSLHTGLAALGFLKRRQFDRFYCTGEDIAIPFAFFMLGVGAVGRITAVIHNGGTRSRRVLFRVLPHRVWHHLICLSREQYRVLVEDLRLPVDRVTQCPQWLDTTFYDPAVTSDPTNTRPDDPTGYVFACGRESRDYDTLQQAAHGLNIPFHVVASGWSPKAGFASTDSIKTGSNIVVEAGGLSYRELRARYHRARLVVVPVREVTYAAGVTSICEGMSMGKAIIATSSPGTRDYVHDGESGWVVPVGDVEALRHAIVTAWNAADSLTRYGARNRAFAIATLRVDLYAASVARLMGVPLG